MTHTTDLSALAAAIEFGRRMACPPPKLTSAAYYGVADFRSSHRADPNELRMRESTLRTIARENGMDLADFTGGTLLGIPITVDDNIADGVIVVALTEMIEPKETP